MMEMLQIQRVKLITSTPKGNWDQRAEKRPTGGTMIMASSNIDERVILDLGSEVASRRTDHRLTLTMRGYHQVPHTIYSAVVSSN